MPDRVAQVVSGLFGMDAGQVTDETSPDTVQKWDSLQHLSLVMALEAEFGISFSPEEAMDMLSVKLIRMVLQERGVSVAA